MSRRQTFGAFCCIRKVELIAIRVVNGPGKRRWNYGGGKAERKYGTGLATRVRGQNVNTTRASRAAKTGGGGIPGFIYKL